MNIRMIDYENWSEKSEKDTLKKQIKNIQHKQIRNKRRDDKETRKEYGKIRR